jgi:phosphatidylglycerol:prolipoprotein diacylglycerol transferase
MQTFSIAFPTISPILISIGPLDIRYYSLAYIVSVLIGLLYIKQLNKQSKLIDISNKKYKEFFADILFYGVLGVILGGRLGYVFFYNPLYYLSNPFSILEVWTGGMSFHGGAIGVVFAMYLLSKKYKYSFIGLLDIIAPAVPIGLFLGRIANFINAELYGKATNVWWAVEFPGVLNARHPSQLYEAFLEGFILFLVALVMWKNNQYLHKGRISGVLLLLYGVFRVLVEFVREGEIYFVGVISMGQILSLPMIIIGFYLLYSSYKQNVKS